ncbi:RYamide neuropeptides-like isoform X1 [Cloeon dipterum]|uniref:RYamide neuropeptides-like isoform X1 n=1 Tax=Cloeon dipterum TaxID=197152 RepID=UPI0032200CC6
MRLVLSWWVLVVVSVVVVSEASGDQQQHQQFRTFTRYGRQNAADAKQLFFTNSRYGKRIPGPMAGNMARLWSGGRPKGNVQPRADKFFINSRYGKRSPPAQSKEEFYPLLTESPAAESQFLVCKYSGMNHLYHCLQRSEESGWSAAEAAAKEGSEESSDE